MPPPYPPLILQLKPQEDVFEPVAELLETSTGVKSFWMQSGGNRPPVSFNWEPQGGPLEGATITGHVPPILRDVKFGVHVQCRGKTFDDAMVMVQQLVTALYRKVQVTFEAQQLLVGDGSEETSTQKNVLTLAVQFTLPLFEQPLDQPGYAKARVTSVSDLTYDPTP